ncbi:MAG TPA: hypothetical protein VLE70_22510, partial [Anaerolineae bacterium]|nr:hypothetical protein [Anaerolineae bacterium]
MRFRVLALLAVSLLLLFTAACGSESAPEQTTGGETVDEEVAGDETADDESAEVDFEDLEDFDRGNFDRPTDIDNQWLPLQPGNQWILEGSTDEDGERIPHRIEFTVTDLTKVIDDVPTVVAFIEDYSDDELVEAELAFYAQDNDGNVWYLGEYPEEYEDGEFVDAPAWIAGLEDAQAGIKMKAEPRLGSPSYSQGWAPAVEWTDRGQVFKLGQQSCVPADCYGNVLIIDEFNQEEPGAFQQKYYARNVGNIQVGWRGEDAQQESLELVEFVKLDPGELAAARAEALKLEERAYEFSPDVYGQTPPSEAPEGVSMVVNIEREFEEFDYDNFDDPTNVDNRWLPLKPGTQWVFEGVTVEDGDIYPHLLTFTITDLTKQIDGVETVVAYIEDISNDQLVEAEIAFYAQDDDGAVWYLGEYPEEYENGEFVAAPAWIAGLENARAGIKMLAEPQVNTPSLSQGFAPVVQWADRGQVYRMSQHTCVPFDCFEDVLIMDEFTLEEPGAIQLKYYAPGVGQV